MHPIKIATLNARGLRGKKRFSIYRWIKVNKLHICFLQETFFTKDIGEIIKRGWNGTILNSYSNSQHSRGVSILISKQFQCKVISTHRDKDGRLLLVNLEYKNNIYSFCNIYCPNDVNDRIDFLENMHVFIVANALSKNVFLGGDFNCVTSKNDRVSGILDKSSNTLDKLKTNLKLSDCWRYHNKDKKEYSYIDPSPRGSNSRIDQWLISDTLLPCTVSCHMTQALTPDHKAVILNFHVTNRRSGHGYWKINNSI